MAISLKLAYLIEPRESFGLVSDAGFLTFIVSEICTGYARMSFRIPETVRFVLDCQSFVDSCSRLLRRRTEIANVCADSFHRLLDSAGSVRPACVRLIADGYRLAIPLGSLPASRPTL